MSKVSIINKTDGKLTRLPFLMLKERVLGKKYDLSIAFVGDSESRRLNYALRKKNKPANILSFPLSKSSGEILIAQNCARREAPRYGMREPEFLAHLFIHGLLHLKGLPHGARMESEEKRLRALVF